MCSVGIGMALYLVWKVLAKSSISPPLLRMFYYNHCNDTVLNSTNTTEG